MQTRRTRLSMLGFALACAIVASPRARAEEPVHELVRLAPPPARAPELAPESLRDVAPPIAFDRWRGLSFGSYLAPERDFVRDDGGVDVVFHFHAGQMAERQLKESGLNAVFVSCGFGLGSGAYADAFASPARFGRMLDELSKSLAKATGKSNVHVRRLGLASWSAGFAAVSRILSVERYYGMVDAVVLNDSIHAQYKDSGSRPKAAAQGADQVDVKMMGSFVRFARDAAAGRKVMVLTHSAIIPPDYASSTEATQALLTAISVPLRTVDSDADPAIPSLSPDKVHAAIASRGASGKLSLRTRADAGNLHVRGFRGQGPRDHFDHLYLVGEALRSWVVPRWKRDDRLVYTLAGEQL
ncbi:MAG: hypothetical protein KF819_23670 [Labilithrix sp.]|nr:hypothetical protein [Labilithrix sp.]